MKRVVTSNEKTILDATLTLVARYGMAKTNVGDIAKEAGVAVGSVYSHFKDKTAFLEALLTYWHEQVEAQLEISESQDTKAAFVALGSLRAALYEATKAVHAQILENGHILRALQTYARLHPEAEDEDWQSLVVRSFAPIGELLDVFSDEITLTDRDLATRMLGVFFNTIFIRSALMPQDTLLDVAKLDAETMINEVTDMAYGYLTLPRD